MESQRVGPCDIVGIQAEVDGVTDAPAEAVGEAEGDGDSDSEAEGDGVADADSEAGQRRHVESFKEGGCEESAAIEMQPLPPQGKGKVWLHDDCQGGEEEAYERQIPTAMRLWKWSSGRGQNTSRSPKKTKKLKKGWAMAHLVLNETHQEVERRQQTSNNYS